MPQNEQIDITPGMQRYIDKNNKYLADRDRYIREEVKQWKFDTIAVHGLYTVQDAIEDYQGAIIEPIFMSSLAGLPRFGRDGRRAGLPDPHLVLLAHRQPLDLLLRVDAGAVGGLRLRRRDRLLLDLLGHGGDHDGRAAVPGPPHPQQARAAELRRHGPVLRRHVPAVQRPADGGTRHRVPLGPGRRRTSTSGRRRSTRTRDSSTANCPAIRAWASSTSRPSPTWPTATTCR